MEGSEERMASAFATLSMASQWDPGIGGRNCCTVGLGIGACIGAMVVGGMVGAQGCHIGAGPFGLCTQSTPQCGPPQ